MKNYLSDVEGLKVGHCHDEDMGKGLTVILAEEGATPGVDVRGSAPGTRETDLIESEKLVDKIHAVVLSGGSAFGLDAAGGVMKYLEEQEIGFKTPFARVPVVSQAVIYDLSSGDPKKRPNFDMGYRACESANSNQDLRGSVGAGLGATVSKTMGWDKAVKSGLGSASIKHKDLVVSAIVVVNALGDIYDGNEQLTGPYDRKEKKLFSSLEYMKGASIGFSNTNTTIGLIATNAKLDKAKANKLASMGHDAYARAIRPVHTMSDGDTVFSLATNKVDFENFDLLLVLAVEAMEKAILDAINSAQSANGYPSLRQIKEEMK
ncbi:MAG: P1 family peptidase [Tissierellia bacterium]|nr:P1 family peptidase [Tissierellia bacterium]